MSKLHMILAGNPGTGKTMGAKCMTGKVWFFMSPFFKLLWAKVPDFAQKFNPLIRKTDIACQNHGYIHDAQGWLFCLFRDIFKDIGIIDDYTVIEVQRSDLVTEQCVLQ